MNHLNKLLKSIEIELRSNNKLSQNTWEKCSELSDWEYRIILAFQTEVNLSIQNGNNNFVYKKYQIDSIVNNKPEFDILIGCTKRNQHDLILTDVINRLVMPENTTYKYLEVWGMQIEQARNYLVQKAFEMKCKYILFIDDDIIPENTALVKLWETMQKYDFPVVAADYQKKADYKITAHGEFTDIGSDTYWLKTTDLCAMGFTLIDIQELSKKVPAPYFWVFAAPDGFWEMGEDAFFTKNVIEHTGRKPLIDLRPSILHYDKVWKRCFGERDNDVTYATNTIDSFTKFDHIRVPPKHPLINICIPTREENDPIATNLETLLCLRGYKTELTRIHGLNVDDARNQLATNAVNMGSEFLLFIDNDVILPEDALCKMTEVMEQDKDHKIGMVIGDYLLKGKVPYSAHLQLDEEGIVTELNRVEDLPSVVDSNWLVGLGCALIRTSVFRQIRYPYFLCMSEKMNKIGVALDSDGGNNEDAYFSEMLLNNGYKIKIMNDIKCIHVDYKEAKMYGYKDFKRDKYSCYEWVDKIEYINIDNLE
jgi:hypothetical protein